MKRPISLGLAVLMLLSAGCAATGTRSSTSSGNGPGYIQLKAVLCRVHVTDCRTDSREPLLEPDQRSG